MVVTDTGHFLKANGLEAYGFLQGYVLVERQVNDFEISERDFPDTSVVNSSLSNAEGAGLISSWGDPTSWEDPTLCHSLKNKT